MRCKNQNQFMITNDLKVISNLIRQTRIIGDDQNEEMKKLIDQEQH